MDTTMALNLVKDQRVDLTKTNPNLTVAHVGLGWDVNAGNSGTFDLDVFAMLLTGGKTADKSKVVFFNNKVQPGVTHLGDNLTGAGDGDDETIKVEFSKLDPSIDEILVCVNIFEADSKRQNFGMVNNAFIRVYDGATNGEILKFDLTEDYSGFSGVVMGKLYKHTGEWKFQATGVGVNGNITQIAAPYAS